MTDFYLTDKRWALIASRLPGKESSPGRHGRDNRLFIEAVLWIVRTGSSWRRLPSHYGKWYSNYTRFHRWTRNGVWSEVMDALAAGGPCEYFWKDGEIHYAPLRPPVAQETGTAPPEPRGRCDGDASGPSLSRSQSQTGRLH